MEMNIFADTSHLNLLKVILNTIYGTKVWEAYNVPSNFSSNPSGSHRDGWRLAHRNPKLIPDNESPFIFNVDFGLRNMGVLKLVAHQGKLVAQHVNRSTNRFEKSFLLMNFALWLYKCGWPITNIESVIKY